MASFHRCVLPLVKGGIAATAVLMFHFLVDGVFAVTVPHTKPAAGAGASRHFGHEHVGPNFRHDHCSTGARIYFRVAGAETSRPWTDDGTCINNLNRQIQNHMFGKTHRRISRKRSTDSLPRADVKITVPCSGTLSSAPLQTAFPRPNPPCAAQWRVMDQYR